jgi:hypothetical protein
MREADAMLSLQYWLAAVPPKPTGSGNVLFSVGPSVGGAAAHVGSGGGRPPR